MNIRKIFKKSSLVRVLFDEFFYYKYRIIYKISPKLSAQIAYKKAMHRTPDLDNPRDLIEKYMWMELNTDTSMWTLCADKYRMRSYVEEKGYGEYLPKLYGHWDNPDDIDFDELPNQFVLKTNNGCGTVMIVRNKSDINYAKTKRKLKQWLRHPYGYFGSQIHYLSIKPCIIAEELLEQDETERKFSPKSKIDYKIWCFNGNVESIWVAINRSAGHLFMNLFDIRWNTLPERLVSTKHYEYLDVNLPKPGCLDKMLEIATDLSKPFNEVRIDFYITNRKPIIGELTFSTGAGYFTQDFYNYLGSKIDISKMKKA